LKIKHPDMSVFTCALRISVEIVQQECSPMDKRNKKIAHNKSYKKKYLTIKGIKKYSINKM